MSFPELYPWLNDSWKQWCSVPERMPHALLLNGTAGLGKNLFARRLAAGLLCQSPMDDGAPCGHCKSCHLFSVGNHPDFLHITTEEDASMIVVDQIRALISYLSLRPHTSSRKVVTLTPAEAMNINAANSLLKALEEPPADTVLILVSHAPQLLSATIRSRCTQVSIHAPAQASAIDWLANNGIDSSAATDLLAAANGAPLRAMELHKLGFSQARTMMLADLQALQSRTGDPVECATRWKQMGAVFCLAWLSGLIADMIQTISMRDQTLRLNNPSLATSIREMAARLRPDRLFELFEQTVESSRLATTPLDDTLLIEDILIRWCKSGI